MTSCKGHLQHLPTGCRWVRGGQGVSNNNRNSGIYRLPAPEATSASSRCQQGWFPPRPFGRTFQASLQLLASPEILVVPWLGSTSLQLLPLPAWGPLVPNLPLVFVSLRLSSSQRTQVLNPRLRIHPKSRMTLDWLRLQRPDFQIKSF